tara:strand:+ start:217 stop:1215 length:999 start_codon:yes stop_codon:yes gene_type:complete
MKKILVTGSDGFIGSHLVERLVTKGFKVRAFTFYNSFNSWGWLDNIDKKIKKELEVISGDVRDFDSIKKASKNCDYIFHLAALVGIPYSYYAPESYIDTNIKGTLNVLRAAKENNNLKIIHTSTSEIYGTPKTLPITELHPASAQSPYAASKVGADHLALSFYKSYGLPISVIRPFNTFGPRQSLRAVIPTIILQALNNKKSIRLGNTYSTRNFNYISDTVDGFVSVLVRKNIFGEIINIGSNFDISIKDTVNEVSKLMNKDISIIEEELRKRPIKSEVERLKASGLKAKKLLKWVPKFKGKQGFIEALKKTIDWYSSIENRKKFKNNIYNY